MSFILIFVFLLVGINEMEYKEDSVHFTSSLSILPPPMDWVCQPANTTFTDEVNFLPEQNIVSFLDWTPHLESVPKFNSNLSMDQMPHVGSVPGYNSSVTIMDQMPLVGSVPEFNSSLIIMDQMPNVELVPKFNSSFIITDQMPEVGLVPEFNSTSKHASFTMDLYIEFSVTVLKLKAASQAFSNSFTSVLETFKLLNFAGLLSFVCLAQVAVAILMALLLWKQRQESLYLHQEINSTEMATTIDLSRLREMRNKLYSEHIQLTKSDNDLSTWDKKMDGVSSKLHDENSNLEEMYKCFMEWKHDWNEQSHKIKQIDTDQFKQIADVPNTNVDHVIKEHENSLRDYFLHADIVYMSQMG